jgi:hypothetical protein
VHVLPIVKIGPPPVEGEVGLEIGCWRRSLGETQVQNDGQRQPEQGWHDIDQVQLRAFDPKAAP